MVMLGLNGATLNPKSIAQRLTDRNQLFLQFGDPLLFAQPLLSRHLKFVPQLLRLIVRPVASIDLIGHRFRGTARLASIRDIIVTLEKVRNVGIQVTSHIITCMHLRRSSNHYLHTYLIIDCVIVGAGATAITIRLCIVVAIIIITIRKMITMIIISRVYGPQLDSFYGCLLTGFGGRQKLILLL